MISNTIWSLAGKVVAMFFITLLDIIIARSLPVQDYAEWVYFFSILTMLFYVGWMGINVSVKVFVSKNIDITDRDNCILASLQLRAIISFILLIIIFLFVPRLSIYLGYPNKYPELYILLVVSAVLVSLNSFTEFFKELFIGLQKYKELFIITVCEYGTYFFFSIITLFILKNVYAVAVGYFVGGICILILGFCILKTSIGFRYSNTNIKYKDYLKPIMKYALPIAVISFGTLILVEMDTFMIGLLSSKEEVAVYNIVKNLCTKAAHVNYALTVGTVTTFSVLTNENVKEKKQLFQKVYRVDLLITVIISVAMFTLGPFAILTLYGEKYIGAQTIFRLLIPYYALYGMSNFCSSFLDFRGKAKLRSICYISVILINFMLNFLWIPNYGAKGAAIATDLSLIPYTIFATISSFKQFDLKKVQSR